MLPLLLLAHCLSCQASSDLFPAERWMQYASAEDAGYSSEKLAIAHTTFAESGAGAAMVVVHGTVLAAWGDVERRFMCHSVRKSFLSALYGIFIAQGAIDPATTLADLDIDDTEPSLTASERQARVIDLLGSRSGIYHTAAMETDDMRERRPARGSHEPGSFFWYNNWDFNALLSIFEQETKTRLFAEFDARIAQPLGMQDFRVGWDACYRLEPERSRHAAYPFKLSARDMARFGLLYLRGGRWRDQQIVPRDWVAESTSAKSDVGNGMGYGYLWWTDATPRFKDCGMFLASGTGGQKIAVLQKLDLVFVHRVDTFRDRSVDFRPVLEQIIGARIGDAKADAKRVPMPDRPKPLATKAVTLDLAKYCGTYPMVNLPPLVVKQDHDALLLETIAGTFRMIARSEHEFWVEDVEGAAVFLADATGHPMQIVAAGLSMIDGDMSLQKGDVARALEIQQTNAKYFPDSTEVLAALGAAQLASGDGAAARKTIDQALALEPRNRRAQALRRKLDANPNQ